MTNEAQRQMTWNELAAELGRAQARIAELEATVNDLSACICGCPLSEHENYGEDGIACEHENHVCLHCFPAVEINFRALEAQAAVLATTLKAEHLPHAEWVGCQTCASLANLPVAVQAHMARDRAVKDAADDLAKSLPEGVLLEMEDVWGLTNTNVIRRKLAAYRAAGGR